MVLFMATFPPLRWALLNLLAGIALTLSFAPFNYFYLAFFSLAFLFCAWQHCTAWQAALYGYCYGLGLFGVGVSWVFVSIYFYGSGELFSSLLLTSLFSAFWALFPALAGYLSVRLARFCNSQLLLIILPVVWILLEYGRGFWLLNGFPWLQIAYSQLDSPYAGYIPLLGVYGTGFLLAFSAALFAHLIVQKKHFPLIAGSLVLILGTGCLLNHQHWTVKIDAPISVTLIQGNISQEQKWQQNSLIGTLMAYQQLTNQHWDSQLIVWPETAIPAYLSQVDVPFLQPLEQQALSHGTDIIVSLLEKDQQTEAVYNSALVLGKKRASYRKNHLLPFGEYMPLQPLSGWVLNAIGLRLDDFSTGGTTQPLLEAAGYPIVTSICYEDAFGSESIRHVEKAAYLVNLTNDAWFGRSIEPHQHLQMARMRALESGRYLLRATNTGATAIIAPNGKLIAQAPLFITTALSGVIFPMTGLTPYAAIGDHAIIIVLFLGLFCLLIAEKFYLRPSHATT